jgi:predicted DNA-binding protein with PD1-like motif
MMPNMTRNCFLLAAALATFALPWTSQAADDKLSAIRVFGTSQIQEVYRVLLDRDALLLESITDVLKQKDVQDGEVLVTAGSVQECSYHYVTSTELKAKNVYKTVKGAFEILNAGGVVASGEPHLHITLSGPGKPAFGGHLEKGCRVLYLAEVTIFKYSGPALTRKENANGISLLQPK